MKAISCLLAILALSLSVAVGQAETPQSSSPSALSSDYDDCLDATGGVTSNILDCTHAEYDRQDDRLNSNYKDAMARLSSARQASLRGAERLWIADRERRCRRELDEEGGGTWGDVLYATCFMETAAERASWMERYR